MPLEGKTHMPDQYSFLDYLDSIEEMMGTWDKHTAVSFSHGTNLGTAREHFVHNILASFLPTTVTVGSGEITDGDRRSGQMDVVLYRSDFPVFSGYGMPETYLFDGVIAAIEVKSRLDSDTICTALKTLSTLASSHQRVRFYPRPKELTDFTDPTTETGRLLYRNRPRTYIIAYKGWKRKDTFLKHAVSAIANSSARPDAIYQPGMCLFRHSPAHPLAISTC